jgi:hypothetical protein
MLYIPISNFSPKQLFLLLVLYVQIDLEIYISKHQLNSIGVFTLHTVCFSLFSSSIVFVSVSSFFLCFIPMFISFSFALSYLNFFISSLYFCFFVLPLCFTTLFHPFVSSVCFYFCFNCMFLFSFISVLLYSCVLFLCCNSFLLNLFVVFPPPHRLISLFYLFCFKSLFPPSDLSL